MPVLRSRCRPGGVEAALGQPGDEPFPDLPRTAVEVDPVVEEVAPAPVRLLLHAQRAGQGDPRPLQDADRFEGRALGQHAERLDDAIEDRVGPAGLHRQDGIVAGLVGGDLSVRRIAPGQPVEQPARKHRQPHLRLVQVVPALRREAAPADIAEGVHVVGPAEADRQRPLRRRVEGEGQVDLVGLQVQHRIGVGRLDIVQRHVQRLGDVLRHVDGGARPLAADQILAEERGLARQRRDAQHAGAANAVERRLARLRRRGLRLDRSSSRQDGGAHGRGPEGGGEISTGRHARSPPAGFVGEHKPDILRCGTE